MFPPSDPRYTAPMIGGPNSAPYSPVNQNVPPPTVDPNSPPLTAYGLQGPSGTNITTPQSQGSNGFLDVVGSTLGHIAQGIGTVLHAPNYLIANPLSEAQTDPESVVDAVVRQFQGGYQYGQTGGQQGSINPMDFWKNMNERWEQNPDPGLYKFAMETVNNPLTYMSAGSLGAVQGGLRGLGEAGLAAAATETAAPITSGLSAVAADNIANAMNPLIAGMSKYEEAVNSAVRGISGTAGGIINANVNTPFMAQDAIRGFAAAGQNALDKTISFIPSDVAKDNARGVLNSILPSGLVENILNYVPEEYVGIPTGPIADYLNRGTASAFGRQLGLPDYISLPDFRRIAVQNAQQIGWQSLRDTLGSSIDLSAVNTRLRAIYSSPSEQLSPTEGYVKSLLQEPSKFTTSDLSDLSKSVGGNLADPNNLQAQSFNSVVGLYRRGAIDTATTVQSLANHLGADLSANPDAANPILDAIRGQDQKSMDFIDGLTSAKDPRTMLQLMSDHAGSIADSDFSTGIAQQRLQNTLFDDFLNNFDNGYQKIWKGYVGTFTRGLNSLGIQTLGMPLMQVGEIALRHIAEGGGMWQSNIDKDLIMAENVNIKNVPFDVMRAAYHGFTDQMDDSLLRRVADSTGNNVLGWLADKSDWMTQWANNSRNTMYLSYWRTALNQEIKAAADAKGFTIRPDASDFMEATNTPDVTKVPELNGVSQQFVNDTMNAGVKAAGNDAGVNGVKNSLDANNINRYALTHSLDADTDLLSNLGVAPRAYLRDSILNGQATSANMSDAIDTVIKQQKAILKDSPPVKADMMQGAVNSIVSKMDSPVFGARDLNNSLSQISSIQSQIADMPWLYRQAEYDATQNAIRSPNGWRGAIHEEANQNIVDILKQTEPILTQAYDALNAQGARLGVQDHTSRIVSLLEADRAQLQANWEVDRNFQKTFFEAKPDTSNPDTWSNSSGTGYYDQRKSIWDGYGTNHAKNMAQLNQAQTDLSNALFAKQSAGEIPPDVNTITHSVDEALSTDVSTPGPTQEWTANAGQHTATIDNHSVSIDRNPSTKRWSFTVTDPEGNVLADSQGRFPNINTARGAAEDYVGQLNPYSIHSSASLTDMLGNPDPQAQGIMELVQNGFRTGQTPTEITSAINDSINAGAGNATPESLINPSSQAVESQVSGAAANSTINQSGNAADVIGEPDPNSFLGKQYESLESTVRPRIEQIVADNAASPKVNQQAMDYLKAKIDKMHLEFNQLPQGTQKVWNDVLDVASQRASDRITQGFTNYNERTNFDALMLHFYPYWMHESQRWPWLTRTFIGKPTALSMWQAYQDQTNQGYVPLSELPLVGGVAALFPGGDSMQINPTRAITPFNPIQPTNLYRPTNYDEGLAGTMQGLDKIMSTLGVSPFDVWDVSQAAAQGQLGSEIPSPIKSALNIARGSNVPGLTQAAAAIQKALPDNYRDYYTRMILASNGFEPDQVYDDALAGDPTATSTLDTAQQQSSLISSILVQTGSIARFRTPEYDKYQEARMNAVASMTGISTATQLAMKNDGVSVKQLQTFTPNQREELANLPGATDFNELTEPLLNPAARKLRMSQRDFYKTLDTERDEVQSAQSADDRRLQSGVIGGVEWRKRYQDRASDVSDMLSTLKKSPAYKDVPVTADEQAQARARFNLPPYTMSPEDIGLQQYYAVKPETDVVTGDVNWSKFFDDRQAVIDSNQTLKPLLEEKLSKNNTPQVVDFKNAADLLRPYFSIKDEILAKYPQTAALVKQAQLLQNQDPVQGQQFKDNNPELKTLGALVRKTQQEARLQFPQIDQALVKYYGAQPAEYQSWAKKYQAPATRQIPQMQAAL